MMSFVKRFTVALFFICAFVLLIGLCVVWIATVGWLFTCCLLGGWYMAGVYAILLIVVPIALGVAFPAYPHLL